MGILNHTKVLRRKVKRFFRKLFTKKGKRIFIVEKSTNKDLVGMRCLGQPKHSRTFVLSGLNRGYRTIEPIRISKFGSKERLEILTKTTRIILKRKY